MSATADTIWRIPAYLPYLQPPLTEAAIAAAEGKIGYKLPAEYLELLKKQNGGYIRYSLPEMVHDCIAGIGPHYPSLTDFDWDYCREHVSFPLQGLVPFDGDGHWHICLDYRKHPDAPSVTHVDVECDHESPIAASFEEYLWELRLDVDDEYVVEAITDIEKLKSELSGALGVPFDPPDAYAHGYPIHCVRLGTEKAPEWIWISPNLALRGIVRPDHKRYAELKDLMPGLAPRFPDVPSDGYILSVSPAIRNRVVRTCAELGMAIRPLREYVQDS